LNVVEEIKIWAGATGLELPRGSAEGLAAFHSALVETGRERGVTALREPEEVLRELILDSLGAAACLQVEGRIADLGSGGGVPGLPLALVRPDCRFLLVESLGRKVAWLEEQVQALGLADRVEIVSRRCEDVGRDPVYRAVLDAVVAKALASLPVLLEYALPLLRMGGRLYAYKGPALAGEIESARHAMGELGGHLAESLPYRVLDRERVICVVEKVRATPDRYPRRVGVPERKPL
jgi:16S rRNA (guanine527-N7)-methyltransferase